VAEEEEEEEDLEEMMQLLLAGNPSGTIAASSLPPASSLPSASSLPASAHANSHGGENDHGSGGGRRAGEGWDGGALGQPSDASLSACEVAGSQSPQPSGGEGAEEVELWASRELSGIVGELVELDLVRCIVEMALAAPDSEVQAELDAFLNGCTERVAAGRLAAALPACLERLECFATSFGQHIVRLRALASAGAQGPASSSGGSGSVSESSESAARGGVAVEEEEEQKEEQKEEEKEEEEEEEEEVILWQPRA